MKKKIDIEMQELIEDIKCIASKVREPVIDLEYKTKSELSSLLTELKQKEERIKYESSHRTVHQMEGQARLIMEKNRKLKKEKLKEYEIER